MAADAKAVLVTGGAGYIGSHAAKALKEAGYMVVVYDNLVAGHREAVRYGPFVEGDITDLDGVRRALREHHVWAVMHFAAFLDVGESVREPAKYYRNNVTGALTVLEAMAVEGVKHFVFSSTCATYGEPVRVPIDETHPQVPISPYGKTKLHIEHMLEDYTRAYGLRAAALRYFNAAGASQDGTLGEDHQPETHLIPLVLQVALGQRPEILIFGDDYPTPDGTCIRDYVHVEDLARAQRARPAVVVLDQLLQQHLVGQFAVPADGRPRLLIARQHLLQRHHAGVAATGKTAVFVIHVGHAAAHAGREVAAGLAQHGHRAAGHVLAAVVTRALHHCGRA